MIQIYQVLLYLSKKIIIKKFFVNGLFGHSIKRIPFKIFLDIKLNLNSYDKYINY